MDNLFLYTTKEVIFLQIPNHSDIHEFPMKKKSKKIKTDIKDVSTTLRQEGSGYITSDVTGSYTGMAMDLEPPTQDADDL